jgi:hydroxymethylpyrimidine/phosphomethylpyrimidine kinase
MIFTALTVGGSDSGGGAGIQADLHTFSRIGVYGTSVITALTAQNTTEVLGVLDIPAVFVRQQWEAVMSDIPVHAMKTGMLGSAANIETAAAMIEKYGVRKFVLDPVLVATSGTRLLAADAIGTLKRLLVPRALLVTPNLDEAGVLAGMAVSDKTSMEEAARRILKTGASFVLVKGGHLEGDALDILFDGAEFHYFRSARIGRADIHGTGCVLSAAITAHLAVGKSVYDAVRFAKDFVSEAIATSFPVGFGFAPCNSAGLT